MQKKNCYDIWLGAVVKFIAVDGNSRQIVSKNSRLVLATNAVLIERKVKLITIFQLQVSLCLKTKGQEVREIRRFFIDDDA